MQNSPSIVPRSLNCRVFSWYCTRNHILFLQIFRNLGWRLGLQMLTLLITSTFFFGMFYRSASLYHPQRRAIMHLKNQKRKIKMKKEEKTKLKEEKLPVIDFYVLKSKTIKILLASTCVTSLGLLSPLFYLVKHKIFYMIMCIQNINCTQSVPPFINSYKHIPHK